MRWGRRMSRRLDCGRSGERGLDLPAARYACRSGGPLVGSSRILVDIPIGLPWRECPHRPCDTLARRHLGPRAPSVFSPPTRAATQATSLAEARELNLQEVGRSVSAQAWGICRKIAEADSLLRGNSAARSRVVEVHPELCFWALNGRRPMAHYKASHRGRQERLAVLERWSPGVGDLLNQVLTERRRTEVMADDVLDAVAACVTGQGECETVDGETTLDTRSACRCRCWCATENHASATALFEGLSPFYDELMNSWPSGASSLPPQLVCWQMLSNSQLCRLGRIRFSTHSCRQAARRRRSSALTPPSG
jgi:predicted RNase H-like nuclease